MHRLTIYRRYFFDAGCYKNAPRQTVTGVQVHSTGANNPWLRRYVQPDDGRIGVNTNGNSHNDPDGTVCANAYIGKQADGTVAVYQTLPWDQRCWLSGSGKNGSANRKGYVGFEICEDGKTDAAYFYAAVMEQAALLTAWLCQTYDLNPFTAVQDHNELHGLGLASNHGDIGHWTKCFSLTMDDFRARVAQYMEDGVDAEIIDCDEVTSMYDAKAINPGAYLNLRAGPGKGYKTLAEIPQGAVVNVINDSDPEWWYVAFQGQKGYAMAQYLEPINKPQDAPAYTGEDSDALLDKLRELEDTLKNGLYFVQGLIDQIEGGG